MRQPPPDQRLQQMLLGSLAAHGLALLLVLGWAQLTARRTPPPQNVLVTKLVRLGTPRPKELLPQKDPAPQAQAAPAPAPQAPAVPQTPVAPAAKSVAIAPPQAAAPTAKERAKASSNFKNALAKMKRSVDGQADGSVNGETDVAQEGDKYASEINTCLQNHYVIRGVDAERAKDRSADVQLWIARDGRITGHKITKTSGLSAMDQAVSIAVQGCGRVSAPPTALRDKIRTYGVTLTFTP